MPPGMSQLSSADSPSSPPSTPTPLPSPADATPEIPPGAPPPSPTAPAGYPAYVPPPAPPPERRTWIVVVVVVVVVAIVVLAALFALGVFKSSSAAGPGVIGPASYYSQDISGAEAAASGTSGGPWTLVGAIGINLTSSISGPDDSALGAGGGCSYTPTAGAPSTVVLPATPSNASLGSASTWVFIGLDSAGDVLYILAAQGQITAFAVGTGSCVSDINEFGSISSISPVNASVIAASANMAGAGVFQASHPGSTLTYVLLGPGPSVASGGVWAVEITTCSFGSTAGGTGTIWIEEFDASTGGVIVGAQSTTESC